MKMAKKMAKKRNLKIDLYHLKENFATLKQQAKQESQNVHCNKNRS